MKFLSLFLLFFFNISIHVAAKDAFDYVYRFIDAKATSTNPGVGPDEFSPRRATQAAIGYWCSEGNHDPETVVMWIGTLNLRASLSGLEIQWAYSPKEVKIMVSNDDGVTEQVALDWRATPSDEPSFDEMLYFPKPVSAQIVKIAMRGSSKSFYGITMVIPISTAKPIVQIVSGVTSAAGEMCLQVSNGNVFTDNTPVVLDYCASAISAGDGRELWRLNHRNQLQSVPSAPAKCLANLGMDFSTGGDIVITDCDEAFQSASVSSLWNFVSYGQIVLSAKNETFCLSQRGTGAGFLNVVTQNAVKASASSNSDEMHDPAKALDGNLQTWWGSSAFPDINEHRVIFDIDIGSLLPVDKVRVDWEYPPFQYTLFFSADSIDWMEVGGSSANPSNVTLDTTVKSKVQYVRLALIRPHPRYGILNNKYLYGIREVEILVNRLETIIEDRYKAGNTKDARDKYFLVAVREFDSVIAKKLSSAEADLQSRFKATQLALAETEGLLTLLQSCSSDVETYAKSLDNVLTHREHVKALLQNMTFGRSGSAKEQLAKGLSIGDTKALAAEDCAVIKRKKPSSQSGFYWLAPRCSTAPFRAWCDMTTGLMIYIWTNNSPEIMPTFTSPMITSPNHIPLRCADMGLEPLVVNSKKDVDSVIIALAKTGFSLSSNLSFPLAYDPQCFSGECSGIYRDFVIGNDLTSLLTTYVDPSNIETVSQGYNTAGFNNKSISFFNLEDVKIGGIFCSTNTVIFSQISQPLSIECHTILAGNPLLQRLIDTNILINCPPGCDEDTTLPVYGSNYVYHETSSICRAALHSGIIRYGGEFTIALEGPRNDFQGSFQYGVESKSLSGDIGGRTFRVGSIPKDCPVDLLYKNDMNTLHSFIQLEGPTHSLSVKSKDNSCFSSFLQTDTSYAIPEVPFEVNILLDKIYNTLDQLHGIDPHLVVLLKQETSIALGKTRTILKPIEGALLKHESSSFALFENAQDDAQFIYNLIGETHSALNPLLSRVKSLSEKRRQYRGYTSWNLCSTETKFSDDFEEYLDPTVSGRSEWKYIELSPLTISSRSNEECKHAIIQEGSLFREQGSFGRGTVALLRSHRFFDFELSVQFFVPERPEKILPVVGIAFRAKNAENMYLLEIDCTVLPRVKRLVRLYKGVPTILAEHEDGGFIPGVWYHVHIETVKSRIRICIGENENSLAQLFDYQDEHHLSGTVGLFSVNTSPVSPVQFSFLRVKSRNCKTTVTPDISPPLPLECTIFKEEYLIRLENMYTIKDAPDNKNGPSSWTYERNIDSSSDGRSRVLTQNSAIESNDAYSSPATMLLTRGRHSCPHGEFRFKYLLPCTSGRVGAVFRYRDDNFYSIIEVSPSYDVKFQIKSGRSFIEIPPIKTHSTMKDSQMISGWTKFSVLFNGPFIQVHLQPLHFAGTDFNTPTEKKLAYHTHPSLIPLSEVSSTTSKFRLGLMTTGCKGILFDNMEAGPVDFFDTKETESIQLTPTFENKILLGSQCITSQSYLERQSLCSQLYIPDGEKVGHCISDFCSNCCHFYTAVASSTHQRSCERNCRVNDVFSEKTKEAWTGALSSCLGDLSQYVKSFLSYDEGYKMENTTLSRKTCLECCSQFPQFKDALQFKSSINISSASLRNGSKNHKTEDQRNTKNLMEMDHCHDSCNISEPRDNHTHNM